MTKQPEGLVRKRRARMTGEGGTDEFDISAVPPLVEKGSTRIGHTYRTESKRWMPVCAFQGPASPEQPFKTHNEAMNWLGASWVAAGRPGLDGNHPPAVEPASPEQPPQEVAEHVIEAPLVVAAAVEAASAEAEQPPQEAAEPGPPAAEPAPEVSAPAETPQDGSASPVPDSTEEIQTPGTGPEHTYGEDSGQATEGEPVVEVLAVPEGFQAVPTPQGMHSEVSRFTEGESVQAFEVPEGSEYPPGWQHRLPVIPQAPPQSRNLPDGPEWQEGALRVPPYALPRPSQEQLPGPQELSGMQAAEVLPDPLGNPFEDDDRNPVA